MKRLIFGALSIGIGIGLALSTVFDKHSEEEVINIKAKACQVGWRHSIIRYGIKYKFLDTMTDTEISNAKFEGIEHCKGYILDM